MHLNFSFKRTYNCSGILFPTLLSLSQYKLKSNCFTSSPFPCCLPSPYLTDVQRAQPSPWVLLIVQVSSGGNMPGLREQGNFNWGRNNTSWGINTIWLLRLSWDAGNLPHIKGHPWQIFYMLQMLILFLSKCRNAKPEICFCKISFKNFLHFIQCMVYSMYSALD